MISHVRITPRGWAPNRLARRLVLAASVATLTAVAAPANAQTTTGNIRGYVRGPNAAAITDAQISARNVDLGQTRGTTTNTSGFYYIPGLRPGRYDVTVRRLGFTAQTRTIDVPIAQTVTLDVALQEAATTARPPSP